MIERPPLRRFRLLSFLLLLTLLALCACAEEGAPAPEKKPVLSTKDGLPLLSEKWYAEYVEGQHAGWVHVVWTASSREGRATVHDHTERLHISTRSTLMAADRFRVSTVIDVERLPDGSLLHIRSRNAQGGREFISEQRFTGDGYEYEERVAGQVETLRVDCDAPVPTDSESFLCERIRDGDFGRGDTLTFPTPDFREGRMRTVRVTAVGHETLPLETGPCRCLKVRETLEGAPVESTLWLDGEGVLRQLTSDRVRLTATTREAALEHSDTGYQYSVIVQAEPDLPRATSLDRAVVELELTEQDGAKAPDFPDTPFSRETSREGGRHVLELRSHDDPAATTTLPVSAPEVERWLRSTTLLCADAPEVKAAAAEAIGEEKDARVAAKKLLAFVFTRLTKGSGPIPDPTAVEILRDRAGDCSEHAVLFVALCRAVGLPARRLSGYAQVGDVWGSHSFTEIWLGKWVGADPTTNELGTKARYIAFGWSDRPDSYPGVVSSRVSGRMRIRTIEFEEDGETHKVADLQGGSRHDPLSDLTLAKPPEGWNAEVLAVSGKAAVEGPGVSCTIGVCAGFGDLTAEMLGQTFHSMGEPEDFAGIPSLVLRMGGEPRSYLTLLVPYRRRCLSISVTLTGETEEAEALATIAEILTPTFH